MRTAVLGEIAEWGSGGTPKRGIAEYFGPGTPWLSITDLNDGVVLDAKESLTPAGIANSSAKVVPPGTILVAMYGSIGKLGITGTEMATSQAIAFAQPKDDVVDRRFLFQYLLAQRPKLQAMGRGGTQMNIGQGDLKAWPILLPPLAEQRRIAAILDRADAIRAIRRQVLAKLDALVESIYRDMFEGHRYSCQPFEALITSQQIGLVRAASEQGPEHPYDYVKMDAITRQGRVDLSSVSRVQASASEVAKYSLSDGDLIFNTRNTRELVGKSAVYRDAPRLYNNNLMRVRFRDNVGVDYLHHFLWSREGRQQLDARKSGTTSVFAIYSRSLMTLEVPVPPVDLQLRFGDRVAVVNARRALALNSLAADEELFASLQSRAFRGEL